MLIIDSPSTNAYFNIASEEYLLGRFPTEDIFLLYVNAPSIIVGKFQNTLAEINLDYVQEKEIKVVRRMSGGGAVYLSMPQVFDVDPMSVIGHSSSSSPAPSPSP